MSVLTNLKPEKVFYFFEEICNIPHPSGGIGRLSNYIAKFAKERNLECTQDDAGNLIIVKNAAPGYENVAGVILQSHIDMVAEKADGVKHVFEADPLKLSVEDGYIHANGTTLGGDDGIGVAYMLAILDDNTLKHPRIEAVFTIDEEVGMIGASSIDLSSLTGKYLLNIDSEAENELTVGCAGGRRVDVSIPVKFEEFEGELFKIEVSGLKGGHSGIEINKERANAATLIGRILYKMLDEFDFRLINLEGGKVDNAIMSSCYSFIKVADAEISDVGEFVSEMESIFKKEYAFSDPDLTINCSHITATSLEEDRIKQLENGSTGCTGNCATCGSCDHTKELSRGDFLDRILDIDSTTNVISYLYLAPNGVQRVEAANPSAIETSLNLGTSKMEYSDDVDRDALPENIVFGILKDYLVRTFEVTGSMHFGYCVRSSVDSRKEYLTDILEAIAGNCGGSISVSGDYTGFKCAPSSPLLDLMKVEFGKQSGTEPEVCYIHAGLECGILLPKCKATEAVSFGPNILGIHTPGEKLDIASTERVYTALINTLEKMNEI